MYYDTGSSQWLPVVVGAQGIQGTQSTQGLQGTQGVQGVQGIQGIQGLLGQGSQGNQGLIGAQGLQGLQGLQGGGFNQSQGLQGLQGAQGTQGLQGSFGTSPVVYPAATTSVGFTLQGLASQTADLQEWKNSVGTVIASVDANGNHNFPNMGFAGKNAIINGGMDIWQRGTSSSSAGYQTADRWYENATASTTFAQEATTIPAGSKYCFKMTAGATASMNISQAIETLNSLQFANQTVTASAQVQASVSTGMTIQLYYSTSVDNPASGTWTTVGAPISGGTATAVSGSFTKMTGTFSVPSTAKSLFLQVTTTSTVANGVIVYVGQVQLELGSTATTFSRAGGSIGGELALCQRYCQSLNVLSPNGYNGAYLAMGAGTGPNSQVNFDIALKVTMRAVPSGLTSNNLQISDGYTGSTALSSFSILSHSNADMVSLSSSGTFTKGTVYWLTTTSTSNAYVLWSAEL